MNVQKEQLGIVYSNLSKAELVMILARKIGFKKAEYAYKDAYFLKHGTKAIAFLIDNTPECQTTYIENYIPGFSNWEIQLPSILIQHTEKGYALRVSLSGKYLTSFIKNEKIYKRQEDIYKNEESFNCNVRCSVCIHCMQH